MSAEQPSSSIDHLDFTPAPATLDDLPDWYWDDDVELVEILVIDRRRRDWRVVRVPRSTRGRLT